MTDAVTVDIALVKRITNRLLDAMAHQDGASVDLSHDYFWSLSAPQLFDMTSEHSELGVGQVSECLDHLARLDQDPGDPMRLSLVWVADVLRALALDGLPDTAPQTH